MVSDYSKNEPDIHRVIERNPWIIEDRFMSFRSNKSIQTTLKTLFGISTTDPLVTKKPDFFFVLSDPSMADYLFVELKGPDQLLNRDKQAQATRDATTFLAARPGRAHVILIGTEFELHAHVDKRLKATDYTFEAILYKDLIDRARARIAYLDDATSHEEEELVRIVIEKNEEDLARLVGLPIGGDDILASEGPMMLPFGSGSATGTTGAAAASGPAPGDLDASAGPIPLD
jgi:hypothetical protein